MQPTLFAPDSTNRRHNLGIKLLALMLMVGGVAGVALSMAFLVLRVRLIFIFFGLLFVLVFGWSALKGLDLWKEKPAGYKWARILFAAQIPLFVVPGFSYWFYTGLNVWLTIHYGGPGASGFTNVGVQFNLGSALDLYVGYPVENITLGINPIAIGALIYLLTSPPPPEQELTQEAINPT